jgi:hypothetical protein
MFTQIAEHHSLHVYGCSPAMRDIQTRIQSALKFTEIPPGPQLRVMGHTYHHRRRFIQMYADVVLGGHSAEAGGDSSVRNAQQELREHNISRSSCQRRTKVDKKEQNEPSKPACGSVH